MTNQVGTTTFMKVLKVLQPGKLSRVKACHPCSSHFVVYSFNATNSEVPALRDLLLLLLSFINLSILEYKDLYIFLLYFFEMHHLRPFQLSTSPFGRLKKFILRLIKAFLIPLMCMYQPLQTTLCNICSNSHYFYLGKPPSDPFQFLKYST